MARKAAPYKSKESGCQPIRPYEKVFFRLFLRRDISCWRIHECTRPTTEIIIRYTQAFGAVLDRSGQTKGIGGNVGLEQKTVRSKIQSYTKNGLDFDHRGRRR